MITAVERARQLPPTAPLLLWVDLVEDMPESALREALDTVRELHSCVAVVLTSDQAHERTLQMLGRGLLVGAQQLVRIDDDGGHEDLASSCYDEVRLYMYPAWRARAARTGPDPTPAASTPPPPCPATPRPQCRA